MFARISQLTLKASVDHSGFEQLNQQWHEAICSQPGYRGYLTVGLGARSQSTITIWDRKADADAWRTCPELIPVLRDLHRLVEDHFVVEGSVTASDLPRSDPASPGPPAEDVTFS